MSTKDEELEFVIDEILDNFNETIKKDFLFVLESIKGESTSFVSPKQLDCFSLALASYIFDLTIYNYSFMRKPFWPYYTSISISVFVGIDSKDNVNASKMLDYFQQYVDEHSILVVKEEHFANIICNSIFSHCKETITDYSLAYYKLPSIFVKNKNVFSEIIDNYSTSKRLLNLYLVEDNWHFSTISKLCYELYDDLKENCPNIPDNELQQLAHDCIENFSDQLVKNSKIINKDLIVALEELFRKMYQQVEENFELFNKAPIEAGTNYGEWLYCFAKLNAYFNVDMLSEEERNYQTKLIMKDVFKNNPKITMMVNEIIDRNDPEIDIVDSTFIYYKYLWDNKQEELGINPNQCAIISMLLSSGNLIYLKDGSKDPNLIKFLCLIGALVIDDDNGNKYDFGCFVPENEMYSHLSFIFRASIASVITTNYYSEKDMKLDDTFRRGQEIFNHIDDLINERFHISRENSEFAKIDAEYENSFKELVNTYKDIADDFISTVDETLSKEEHQDFVDEERLKFDTQEEKIKFTINSYNFRYYHMLGLVFLNGRGFKDRIRNSFEKDSISLEISNIFKNCLSVKELTTKPSRDFKELDLVLTEKDNVKAVCIELPDCIYESQSKFVCMVLDEVRYLYFSAELYEESNELGLCLRNENRDRVVLTIRFPCNVKAQEVADKCIEYFIESTNPKQRA